jgi:hypothetical protein
MQPRERVSNFEFWSERGRSLRSSRVRRWWLRMPQLRLPPLRIPAARWRPVAAAALIAGLTAAWLMVGHRGAPAVSAASPEPRSSSSISSIPSTSSSFSTTVPVSADCRGLSPARREVRCTVDAVAVDVRLLSSALVGAAYRRASGADVAARSGAPACAHGAPDERAWSAAVSPISAVGRYRCRFEHGFAAMWWTHGDRLVHAVAPDGDLAALFAWWRTHLVE